MKRIACVPLLQEIWALKLQIAHLIPLVDSLIVVEGDRTFAGYEKFMYFEHYQEELNAPPGFVRYVRVSDMPEVISESYVASAGRIAPENRWPLDRHIRKAAVRGFTPDDNDNDTIVFVHDVDEFISEEAMKYSSETIQENEVISFSLADYRGSISPRGRRPDDIMCGYATKLSTARKNDMHFLRRFVIREGGAVPANFRLSLTTPEKDRPLRDFFDKNLTTRSMENAGWHLSSMHGYYQNYLTAKVQNFAHSESWRGDERLSITSDQYAPMAEFVMKNFDMFDQTNVDENIPEFIRSFSANFPIMLERRTPNVALKSERNP